MTVIAIGLPYAYGKTMWGQTKGQRIDYAHDILNTSSARPLWSVTNKLKGKRERIKEGFGCFSALKSTKSCGEAHLDSPE